MQEGRIPNVIFMSFLGIFCAGTLKVQNAAADIGPVRIEIRAKARAWQRTKEGKMSVSQISASAVRSWRSFKPQCNGRSKTFTTDNWIE